MAKKLSIYAGLVARLASLSKGAVLTHFVDRALEGGGMVSVYDLREDLNIDGDQVLADLRSLQETGWLVTAPPTPDDLEDAGYFPVVTDQNPQGQRLQGLRIKRCVIEVEVVWNAPEKQKELDFGPATVSVKFSGLEPQGGQGEPLPRGLDTGFVSTTRSVVDEIEEAIAETQEVLDSAEEGPMDAWLRWLAEQVLYEEGDGPYLIRLKSGAHAQAVEALGGMHVRLASGAEVELVANDFTGQVGPGVM